MAPIAVSDIIPDRTLSYFDEQDQLQNMSIHSLAKGKKVILFAVPGAFTPTCIMKHVSGFIEKSEEFISKGVSEGLSRNSRSLSQRALVKFFASVERSSMLSVPATVSSQAMDKSIDAGEAISVAAVKRIQVKRNVGGDGSRIVASPRPVFILSINQLRLRRRRRGKVVG